MLVSFSTVRNLTKRSFLRFHKIEVIQFAVEKNTISFWVGLTINLHYFYEIVQIVEKIYIAGISL